MDEPYCGPARQVHFNRAVAEYGGWFIQDLHDITGDVSTRGMSGVGWHSGIKPAMERIRMVADAMLAFDDEYAELLEARWQAKSEAPTVNPYCEERADLVLTFLSGDGSGIASAFKRDCRVITAKAEHLTPLANQVLDDERYRVRREYGRRRALFEARTSGTRPQIAANSGMEQQIESDLSAKDAQRTEVVPPSDSWTPMEARELCKMIGVTDPRTLRRRIEKGVLRARPVDGNWRLYLVDPAEITRHEQRKEALRVAKQ